MIRIHALLLCFFAIAAAVAEAKEDVYQSPDDFIAESFDGSPPEPGVLWLTKPVREGIKKILGHDYNALRIRYWSKDGRTAWVLDEIGMVKPITTGFVIKEGRIERLKVLIYRESHGWEVKYPFFTGQFRGATLGERGKLNRPIDGIAGATLSVNALKKLGALALYLDRQTRAAPNSQ